jgi:hypothetical protein
MSTANRQPSPMTRRKALLCGRHFTGAVRDIVPDVRDVQAVDFVSDDSVFAGTMTMTWEVTAVDGGTRVDITANDVRMASPPRTTGKDSLPPLRISLRTSSGRSLTTRSGKGTGVPGYSPACYSDALLGCFVAPKRAVIADASDGPGSFRRPRGCTVGVGVAGRRSRRGDEFATLRGSEPMGQVGID